MTEPDGSMTDRWLGVFRSVDHEPIGDARYAVVRAHQRSSVTSVLVGFAFVAAPPVLTVIAIALESPASIVAAVFSWFFGPILGPGMAHMGFKRLRHLRALRAESEVEIFVGTAPVPATRAELSGAVDNTTGRLLAARVIAPGRRHHLVVHPETGLLLEVDGALVKVFVGGDVSITARGPSVPAVDPAATVRPLGVLEKHELKLLSRRLTRGTWGPLLGTASAVTAVAFLLWTCASDGGPNPDVVIPILTVGGSLLLVAAVDWWHRRRLRAKLQRDSEAGLRREHDRWLLAESGICWESNDLPGPLRLTGGGIGNEADGRTRPVLF